MIADAALDTSSPFGTHRARIADRLIWKLADWRGFPSSWRRRLRKRFARPRTGPFDVVHHEMKFRLYPAENYCDRVIFGRGKMPEQAELGAILRVLKPGMVLVDIGANVGSYAVFAGVHLRGDLTLVAFEPHPRTYAKLSFNLAANGLPAAINEGVGPQRATLELWSDGGSNIGHTSMLKAGTANPKVSVKVPVVPLLDTLREREIDHIDLLKIDIEGFEDQALAPFFDTADESLWPQKILIEVAHRHLWQRDLMEMLHERGYREVFQTPENRLLSL